MSVAPLIQELIEAGIHPAQAADVVTRAFVAGCQSISSGGATVSKQEPKPVKRMPWQRWRLLREQVLIRDGFKCHYCGEAGADCVDHVVALANGGTDDPANLVASCRSCNASKKDYEVEEWRARRD